MSKEKSSLVTVSTEKVQPRFCSLFHWTSGRFIDKSASYHHLFQLGELTAKLHESTRGFNCKHRRYWTADGLLGAKPKFGNIDQLPGIRPQAQRLIIKTRDEILRKLRTFEKRFPERMGLIHADLHFGNVLFQDGKIGAIDFDDCGFGFHAYDLVIPLSLLRFIFPDDLAKQEKLKTALLAGYASRTHFDKHDIDIIPALVIARMLIMIGWLNLRSDNSKLYARMPKAVERFCDYMKSQDKRF